MTLVQHCVICGSKYLFGTMCPNCCAFPERCAPALEAPKPAELVSLVQTLGELALAAEQRVAELQAYKDADVEARRAMLSQTITARIEELEQQVAQLTAALADADRRAGAAERAMAGAYESLSNRSEWLAQAKRAWGVDANVSFDVVWQEALAMREAYQALTAEAERPTTGSETPA